MKMCEKIRAARERSGLSVERLAIRMNIPIHIMMQYENGLRKPQKETLQRIAAYLECDISDLLPDNEIVKKPKEPKQKKEMHYSLRVNISDYLLFELAAINDGVSAAEMIRRSMREYINNHDEIFRDIIEASQSTL